MSKFRKKLGGTDLRSIGKSNKVAASVKTQQDFDLLFNEIYDEDRVVVLHTVDALEKITTKHPQYLSNHKKELLNLLHIAENKELKWHLALIAPRLPLNTNEVKVIWKILTGWANDKSESRIVRVNSIQALYEFLKVNNGLNNEFQSLIASIQKENIPSLNARIKKLKF